MTHWALIGAMAAAMAQPQSAPPTPPPQDAVPSRPPQEPATRVDDVLITGTLEERARAFVESASAPANYRGLGRWNTELCIGVVGLRAEAADQIIDRISETAVGLGIALGSPGCSPNAVIIAAPDGQALADALVGERRRAFRIGFTRTNRGTRALETFRTSEAPVRWWHISFPHNAKTGNLAIRIFQGPPADGNSFSRTFRSQHIVDYIARAVVVLDMPRLEGMSFDTLADYLTMIVLAQVDPEGDTSAFDTVLNAFAAAPAVDRLTDWDLGYLNALYNAGPNRVNGPQQADALAEILKAGPAPVDDE